MLTPSDLGLPADRFPAFREYGHFSQLDTATNIAASASRFQLLSSPTGSGKSLINMTVSRLRGDRVLYLTVTKGLESQLYSDFSSAGLYDIRGHRNYSCAAASYGDDGDLLDLQCTARAEQNGNDRYDTGSGAGRGGNGTGCGYRRAVELARKSSAVVSNYAHWISLAKVEDPDRLGQFDLIVCDEAHLVHDLLVDQIAVEIDYRYVSTVLGAAAAIMIPPSLSIAEWGEWARHARAIARDLYRERRNGFHTSARDQARLTRFGKDLTRIISAAENHDRSPWIVERTAAGAKLLPVWGRDYAEQYLFRGIGKVLLSSATLLETDGALLGASASDSTFWEIDSCFPASRRPFIFLAAKPEIRVRRGMSEGETRMYVNRVDKVIESRPSWKGIIHSRSYGHAQSIYSRSKHQSRLLTHDSRSARATIEKFKRSPDPLVLVSPAVEEGHDFANDLARWQLIYKVPFIYGGSDLIRARSALDRGYVNYLAQRSILQMYGRLMRSATDWGETIIADWQWSWFRKSVKWPAYFRAAWRQVDRMPPPLRVG